MARTPILALIVAAIVAVVAAPGFVKLDEPNSDGLFYEVQRLQVQGHSEAQATREGFDGAPTRQTAQIEDAPSHEVRVLDPAWVKFSKQFYERRWLVPGVAAPLSAIVRQHARRAVRVGSLLGHPLL